MWRANDEGGTVKQRMQEDADLFICMLCVEAFEWVCLHVCQCFCMEEEEGCWTISAETDMSMASYLGN